MPQKLIDITGQRFGMLVVLERSGMHWTVKCDCGTTKVAKSGKLRAGLMRSCGCQRPQHGGSVTPEYMIWGTMIQRCTNPRNKKFADYGGRGISVCNRWMKFAAFLADMGPRPTPRHSIDRKDNNGHYEPGNCRWATPELQRRNKRTSHTVTIEGRTQNLVDWSKESGIGQSVIGGRLKRGWTPSLAVTAPLRPSRTRGPVSSSPANSISTSTATRSPAR